MAKNAKKKEKLVGPTWLTATSVVEVNNRVWMIGKGKLPADIMFISDRPNSAELGTKKTFEGEASKRVMNMCTSIGINVQDTSYCTYAVKYVPPDKRAINTGDISLSRPLLLEEIKRADPKVIVCMGSKALNGVLGNGTNFDHYNGAVVPLTGLIPELPDIKAKLVTIYHPVSIFKNPAAYDAFMDGLQAARRVLEGIPEETETSEYICIQKAEELETFCEYIIGNGKRLLTLDCEWHGVTWMSQDRYFRTVQLGYDEGNAVVIEFTDVDGVQVMDDPVRAWAALRKLLTYPGMGLSGHNILSDGEWLLAGDKNVAPDGIGIDIRDNVVYDTMLAEYLINEMGPFGLEALTCKYTKMGRYDRIVAMWRAAHTKDPRTRKGFGNIPRELLIPYGADDVIATWRIMARQKSILLSLPNKVMEPRGTLKQYPSLWAITMGTQRIVYELEMSGMLVDVPLLDSITDAYEKRLQTLEAAIVIAAKQHGMEAFNHRASAQKATLLFDKLKLQPVKTTKGKAWGTIRNSDAISQGIYKPAVDKTTLEILENAHPVIKVLSNISRIDTIVKNLLKEDEDADQSSKGGGIKAKIWPDGKLHTHFSQLSDTGRFKHSKPNSANWPKKAESYMADIFGGKDKVPPALRTVIIPTPGYVFMEGDFVQAELFVLAALSGDTNMWDALTTPGKDMHDLTAISSFKLGVFDPQGKAISDTFLVEMAKADKKAFKAFQETLTYVKSDGSRMTRKEFKDSMRISAKNLNFGIPYGRGAADIARQVKAETGTSAPLSELENEISSMMDVWKKETYVQAWNYMEQCAESVVNPGFLRNPWGRLRRYPKQILEDELNGFEREAQNFPIQSTVADTCMIAMQLMVEYRQKHGLHFRMVNQIHDAIMLELPEAEIEQTKQMFKDTMGSIDIPINDTRVLRLGVDVEVLTRWGEKQK